MPERGPLMASQARSPAKRTRTILRLKRPTSRSFKRRTLDAADRQPSWLTRNFLSTGHQDRRDWHQRQHVARVGEVEPNRGALDAALRTA